MVVLVTLCFLAHMILVAKGQGWLPIQEPIEKGCINIVLRSTENTIDQQLIEDSNGEPAEIYSATVTRPISKVKCKLDLNFFIKDSFIIVKKGCHAQFKVCYKIVDIPGPSVPPGCKRIRLLSRLNREVEQTLADKVISMKLVTQHPDGVPCEAGINYGYRGNRVFANAACRADFEVCFRISTQPDVTCKEIVVRGLEDTPVEQLIEDDSGKGVQILRVGVQRLISDVACVQNRNFRFNDTYLIVNPGCSARFEVCYKQLRINSTPRPGCITVRLFSTKNNPVSKTIPLKQGYVKSIVLLSQYSGIKCLRNNNYGHRGNELYAQDGCRGEFKICLTEPVETTPTTPQSCTNVVLASWDSDDVDSKTIKGVDGRPALVQDIRLIRQVSDKPCKHRSTFYASGSDVIALNGCRGTFRVCYV